MSTFNHYQLFSGLDSGDCHCITSVSRIPNSMEIFWIAANGSVQHAYWYEGGNWGRNELAPPGSTSSIANITSISRISNSMEIFWIAANGSVQGAYWYEGGNWQRYELAPAGSASLNGGIAVISRIPNSMEVFWIGVNRSVQHAYWYEGANWERNELASAESASSSGGIAVISRISNSMEVFWIGANRSVQHAYWYEGANWERNELAPAGSASFSRWGIAGVSRIPNSMEVFWIGVNGSVQHAYWYEGANWEHNRIAPVWSASVFGGIAVVSRIPNSMEVFWIGADGSIQDAYWYEGAAWQSYKLAPTGSATIVGNITALSRIPNSMEVFWIGERRSIQDAYWYDDFNIILHKDFGGEGKGYNGWVEVTINRNGNVRFKGHFHNHTVESLHFNIGVSIYGNSPVVLAMQKSGRVQGAIRFPLGKPHRNFDWDETTYNPDVEISYDNIIKNIKIDVHSNTDGDISGAIGDIINFVVKWIGGAILINNPYTGIIVFIGVELGSVATGAGFIGGARVIGSILWCAGPYGTLYAIASEGIAKIGENERELTDFEYNFANNNVFKGTLPPKKDIILTDTIGGSNRAFTMPRYDGKITINIGKASYHDPLHDTNNAYPSVGQLLVHELTHAWQIKNTHWSLSLLASALASKVCEIGGGHPYDFGKDATKPFGDFNLEQQAHIVDAWFDNCAKDGNGNIIDDISSPWYHYIAGNIRVGKSA
jgi:hypothetical protein